MIREVLGILNITDCTLTVLIVGDRKIRALNRKYFQKDSPTNVISFPYNLDVFQDGTESFEGDVIVSLDCVLREVEGDYLNEEEKVFYYALHGLLHIIGHDHDGAGLSKKMRRLQNRLFREVTGKEVA